MKGEFNWLDYEGDISFKCCECKEKALLKQTFKHLGYIEEHCLCYDCAKKRGCEE